MNKHRAYGIILLIISIFMYGTPLLDGDMTAVVFMGFMGLCLTFMNYDDIEEEGL